MDYCYVSIALLAYCRVTAFSRYLVASTFTKLPLLNFSRMVRPRGQGRGRGRAPEHPPPPDYMAAMMQQFELNRQFMTNIMA